MIREYLENRRRRKAHDAYDNGWDWAAGQLLRGIDVEAYIEHFGFREGTLERRFDRGAADAVAAWRRRLNGGA